MNRDLQKILIGFAISATVSTALYWQEYKDDQKIIDEALKTNPAINNRLQEQLKKTHNISISN